jgi:hypothetical protein
MKKAQAALEFLTTYGWAFLVILIMIGALAYFGVLNPGGLLPARCTFSPEITCIEHRVLADPVNTIDFRFRNNAGQMANFSFTATEVSTNNMVGCTFTEPTSNPDCTVAPAENCQLRAGRVGGVTCDFTGKMSLPAGDKMKFELNATYIKAGGSYATPVKGEIYAEAQ